MKYIEILSLAIFAFTYYFFGLIKASLVLSITSLLTLPYLLRRRSKGDKENDFQILSSILVIIMGMLTAITGNSSIIKMKPSILYSSLAFFIYILSLKEIYLIKKIFERILLLEDVTWKKLSTVFSYFFIFLAILNEIVWRNFEDSDWVSFKIIFCPLATFMFFASIFYVYRKNLINKK
ncbi:Intracellular septation protein A [Candidatus Cyrtobacter comes]|uniref:Intracellular septation protein A n=1 Tax=Candidatus Cyrtobacter comes TaxID=675776 RepID=A0ABU5L759_9RICK|nr:septation protein IspZ [Candidatus Cyrtobacter comes]MDZ5761954.1 Intracellular septation protein A [Candidatus Cyrtobacter comes]